MRDFFVFTMITKAQDQKTTTLRFQDQKTTTSRFQDQKTTTSRFQDQKTTTSRFQRQKATTVSSCGLLTLMPPDKHFSIVYTMKLS